MSGNGRPVDRPERYPDLSRSLAGSHFAVVLTPMAMSTTTHVTPATWYKARKPPPSPVSQRSGVAGSRMPSPNSAATTDPTTLFPKGKGRAVAADPPDAAASFCLGPDPCDPQQACCTDSCACKKEANSRARFGSDIDRAPKDAAAILEILVTS